MQPPRAEFPAENLFSQIFHTFHTNAHLLSTILNSFTANRLFGSLLAQFTALFLIKFEKIHKFWQFLFFCRKDGVVCVRGLKLSQPTENVEMNHEPAYVFFWRFETGMERRGF